jgi:hypothetical protein
MKTEIGPFFTDCDLDCGSGLAAQTERLDSLLGSLGKHTGDKRLLSQAPKQKSVTRNTSLPDELDGNPLLDMQDGEVCTGTHIFRKHYLPNWHTKPVVKTTGITLNLYLNSRARILGY